MTPRQRAVRRGAARRCLTRRGWRGALVMAAIASVVGACQRAHATEVVRWCHEVVRGDSLTALGARYGTSAAALARLSSLRLGSRLRIGRILALPRVEELRQGRLLPPASPLRTPPGYLRRENAAADRERLSRMRNRGMVERFVRARLLVPVAARGSGYWVDGVPDWLRVARPWTRQFVDQLARAMAELFGVRLKVTSLTRTVGVQRSLAAWNGNAAPAHGAIRSTHLTGSSVDLSKVPYSEAELRWLRVVLRRLTDRGLVSAIEEFAQPHFHVMVHRRYTVYGRALSSAVLIGGC